MVDFPEEPYVYLSAAQSLVKICSFQKNHQYGVVVRSSRPYYPEDFNDFLHFLGEQNLKELGEISLAFLQEHKAILENEAVYLDLIKEAEKYAFSKESNNNNEFIEHEKY